MTADDGGRDGTFTAALATGTVIATSGLTMSVADLYYGFAATKSAGVMLFSAATCATVTGAADDRRRAADGGITTLASDASGARLDVTLGFALSISASVTPCCTASYYSVGGCDSCTDDGGRDGTFTAALATGTVIATSGLTMSVADLYYGFAATK